MDGFSSSKIARFFVVAVRLVCCFPLFLETKRWPHSKTRKAVLSKQLFVPKRGKKKCSHFFMFVNHLNQRNLPSATLVSKEIETEFRSSFSLKSRKFLRGVMSSFDSRGWTQAIKHMAPVPTLGAPPPCNLGRFASFNTFVRIQFLSFLTVLLVSKGLGVAVSTITDDKFEPAILECLSTDPVDGLCASSEYGSMPDWYVSLVKDMIEAFKGQALEDLSISS